MACLVNDGIAARDMIGTRALALYVAVIRRFQAAADFPLSVAAAEQWFGIILKRSLLEDSVRRHPRAVTSCAALGSIRW